MNTNTQHASSWLRAPATLATLILGIVAACPGGAQELHANNTYPDAPLPELLGTHAIPAPVPRPRTTKHGWFTANRLSTLALIAGEAIDSWGTYKNMTHTRWICGNSPAFAGSYDTNVPTEISGLTDVQTVCGTSPAGQPANWAFDVTRVGYFTEGGWVTQIHLAGKRDYAAVEAWNLANDLGWYLLAHRLGKRRDWIGKTGPALNLGRGLVHLELGLDNLIAVRHQQNPNTLNLYIPKDSNYTAPRWWGKR